MARAVDILEFKTGDFGRIPRTIGVMARDDGMFRVQITTTETIGYREDNTPIASSSVSSSLHEAIPESLEALLAIE